MTRVHAFASTLALVLLAPAARADDTYDLRALIGREGAVGERWRTVETDHMTQEQRMTRQGGPAPAPRKDETHGSKTYVDEILAVGADHKATRTRRTYEAYKDKHGGDVDVSGVIIVITRTEGADSRLSFAAAEGSKPIPPALNTALTHEMQGENDQRQKGLTDEHRGQIMFPEHAQAVHATWPIDVAQAATVFGMEAADLDLPTSQANGTIEGIEEKDGHHYVHVKLTVKLMIKRMQGQPLPTPAPMDITMNFLINAAGDGPDGEMHMAMHMALAMSPQPGMNVNVTIDNEHSEVKTRP